MDLTYPYCNRKFDILRHMCRFRNIEIYFLYLVKTSTKTMFIVSQLIKFFYVKLVILLLHNFSFPFL